MNTTTAEKPVEKDKAEKRRALGRGLASLLPGPRAVVSPAQPAKAGHDGDTVAVRAQQVAAGQQIPHPARNDNAIEVSRQAVSVSHLASGAVDLPAAADAPGSAIAQIPLGQIDHNPHQTRVVFEPEQLQELADSIRANGVMQPVIVRPGENGRYVLIIGERRCKASELAGKTTIPAIVRRVSEQQAAEMTIIENLQREDLNALEQAEGFRILSRDFHMTQEEIGKRVGLSRESVSNYMRLLKLPPAVQEYMRKGQLDFTQARELLRLENPEIAEKAAHEIVKKHLRMEQIEELIAKLNGWPASESEEKKGTARWVDPNVRAAQAELERLLAVRVRIKDRNGKGKIVIEYATVDDYERVVEALRRKQ